MVERLEKAGLSFAANAWRLLNLQAILSSSELKSRPGKASPLFLGLIAASCGELESVLNPASAHQHVISNGTKNVFVNGASKKATNGLADVRYNHGFCNGLYTR